MATRRAGIWRPQRALLRRRIHISDSPYESTSVEDAFGSITKRFNQHSTVVAGRQHAQLLRFAKGET